MSAPTVDRTQAPNVPESLPWPLRIVAAIGRVMLRLRRGLRRGWRRLGRLLEVIGRSPVVAAPVAALSVAAVSFSCVALVVAGAWWGGVEAPGPWQLALAVTGNSWVMSYGVPIQLLGVDYSLIPWGLALVPLWLAHQAGRWLVRVTRPQRWRTLLVTWTLAVAAGAAFVGAASVLSESVELQTSARRGVLMALVVGAVGVGSGLLRASDLSAGVLRRLPAALWVIVRASLVGFAALVGFATVALLVAASMAFTQITEILTALEPTMFDVVVLVVLSLGYLPTMIGWSLSYLVGAGVTLAPDVLASPFVPAIAPTPLPAFPPLAALPHTAGPGSWALPVLGVLAGALVGLAVSRLAAREGPLVRMALALAAALASAGLVFVLLWLSTGSLGDGRLSTMGPDPQLGSLLAGVALVIGALPTSVLRARRRARRLRIVKESDDAKPDHAGPDRTPLGSPAGVGRR